MEKEIKTKEDLKPFSNVIQICPECGKMDVYLNDRHNCNREYEEQRQLSQEYYD